MEKISRWIKNNLLFFLSLIFLFMSLLFMTIILHGFRIHTDMESTRVGHIYLGNRKNSYENTLNQQIPLFIQNSRYYIDYQDVLVEVDLEYFDFDLTSTINRLSSGNNNQAYFMISETNKSMLEDDLLTSYGISVFNSIDIDKLLGHIQNNLSILKHYHEIDLANYIKDTHLNQTLNYINHELITSSIRNDLAILDPITIESSSYFSLLDELSIYDFDNETLSYIASAILNLAIESHFSGFIFNQFDNLPNWSFPGINVRILSATGFDLSFYNPYSLEYAIEFELKANNEVEVRLLGLPYINSYEFNMVNLAVSYNTTYIEDDSLIDEIYKVLESETEIIYQKTLVNGVDDTIIRYERITSSPNALEESTILFFQRVKGVTEVISENVVPKGSE